MHNKITTEIELLGGLGNQLFGYFFGVSVASKLKSKLVVDTSIIGLGSNSLRQNELAKLHFTNTDVVYKHKELRKHGRCKVKLLLRFNLLFRRKFRISEEKVNSSSFRFHGNQKFSGYYQNWFYVDYYSKISSKFDIQPKSPSSTYLKLRQTIDEKSPICLHLRVGDYLNYPKIYTILPSKYFVKILNLQLTSHPDREVWIFTEDADSLKFYDQSFVSLATRIIDRSTGLTDIESFMLMTQCKTLIATNSTYSLWAAWFVWKSGNIAYVPFQSYISSVSDDLMDERWNRYDFEKDIFYPGKFNQEKYNQLEREFLSKFA